jgi:hypothetical protein
MPSTISPAATPGTAGIGLEEFEPGVTAIALFSPDESPVELDQGRQMPSATATKTVAAMPAMNPMRRDLLGDPPGDRAAVCVADAVAPRRTPV